MDNGDLQASSHTGHPPSAATDAKTRLDELQAKERELRALLVAVGDVDDSGAQIADTSLSSRLRQAGIGRLTDLGTVLDELAKRLSSVESQLTSAQSAYAKLAGQAQTPQVCTRCRCARWKHDTFHTGAHG